MEHAKTECHCFVRHATTPEQRAELVEKLEYFRSIGDVRGTTVTLMQMTPCPSPAASANR